MTYLILICLILFQQPNTADTTNTVYDLHRLSEPIVFNGMPDDEAWQKIPELPLVMYQPVYLGEMTQKSVIKVAYDDEFMYIAGMLYDSEPDKIVANTLYRNRYSGDETFAIILDTFNDNENARWFFVTPTGVRVDQQVSNNSEGPGSINRDWNTFWDVETQITNEGWFVEMRIPFSSLGFREVNDEVIMGMIAYRYIARNAERHIFPDIPPRWSRGFTKPSEAQKIRMNGIEYRRPVYFTPYILGGFEQFNRLNTQSQGYERIEDTATEIGLDIKFPISGNMNLDITLNTDFAQAEADEAQVNLSRFPLFFPEKRQFFQERSDIYDFNLGGNNRLFYSRRIGLEEGQQVRILGGARLAGRTGKWEIGLLNMQTDAVSSLGLSTENFGVYRVQRDVINQNSYVGSMVTSRIGRDGSYNIGTGFDFLYNYSGNDYLDIKYAATFDDRFEDRVNFFDNSIIRLFLNRRSSSGFYYDLTAKRAGLRYVPEMGFESRVNFTLFDGKISYGYYNSESSPIRITTPSIRYFVSLKNSDNSVESILVEQPWELDFKDGSSLNIKVNWTFEDIQTPLRFSENTFVEPGDYSFYGLSARYSMSRAKRLRFDLEGQTGTFFDGNQASFTITPSWNQSKHLEIGADAEFNILRFDERDQKEYLNIYRIRSLIALNTQVSLQLLTQYNHLARQVGTNARFRYNFSEGHDLWVVYNEITNTYTERHSPALPRFENRVFLLKYNYTI